MTDLERKVLEAAREWLMERAPHDWAEKALAVAIIDAYPDELHTRETCDCGEQEECEECPTAAQSQAALAQWRLESAKTPAGVVD